jgi:hypothetical protein
MEITKENYYDLYNMAVCLLKSVDSLDPDKINHPAPQRKTSEVIDTFLLSSHINYQCIVVINVMLCSSTFHNKLQLLHLFHMFLTLLSEATQQDLLHWAL